MLIALTVFLSYLSSSALWAALDNAPSLRTSVSRRQLRSAEVVIACMFFFVALCIQINHFGLQRGVATGLALFTLVSAANFALAILSKKLHIAIAALLAVFTLGMLLR
ncbi:MAG: hypothetical protein AAF542_07255 [Pseudomonadota bacterium]